MKSITELEKDLTKINEDLASAKEVERLQSLQKKQAGLKEEFQKLLASGKETGKIEKELKDLAEELWVCEAKVRALKDGQAERTEKIKSEIMARKRKASEVFAGEALGRISHLKDELEREAKSLFCSVELWMRNRAFRWNQTSARKFVEMGRQVPVPGNAPRIEKELFELYKVPLAEAAGWKVLPGQDLSPEPVDASNGILIQAVSPPEVIDRAASLGIKIDSFEILVTDEDVQNFEREVLKET